MHTWAASTNPHTARAWHRGQHHDACTTRTRTHTDTNARTPTATPTHTYIFTHTTYTNRDTPTPTATPAPTPAMCHPQDKNTRYSPPFRRSRRPHHGTPPALTSRPSRRMRGLLHHATYRTVGRCTQRFLARSYSREHHLRTRCTSGSASAPPTAWSCPHTAGNHWHPKTTTRTRCTTPLPTPSDSRDKNSNTRADTKARVFVVFFAIDAD